MTLDSCLTCSWDLITAGFMERFLWFKRSKMKEVICFLSTLPLIGEWSHSCCVVRNCQYLLSLNYFRNFVWILQARVSSLFFVGFIEVVEENNTSVVCGRNWYFFRVHYKTDYPSDNSGQPCLKEGPTKDSLFSVKSGQAYPLRFHFSKVEPVFQFLDWDLNLILVGWLLGKLE